MIALIKKQKKTNQVPKIAAEIILANQEIRLKRSFIIYVF